MSKTKADQCRLDQIHAMPCLCCEMIGLAHEQPSPTEANHLVDSGYRAHSGGHQATLPVCAWHHRAICLDGWTSSKMLAKYGPSMKYQGEKYGFSKKFGSLREQLAVIDERLRVNDHLSASLGAS